MTQLILTMHTGFHDASVALFQDYKPLAAVQLERLTRIKGDGRDHPNLAIDEVLAIAGATRRDIDVVGLDRMLFLAAFYRKIRGTRWVHWQYRKYLQNEPRRDMTTEILRYQTSDADKIFDAPKFRKASGFRDDAIIYFYNHHESHALAPLFHTSWNEALLFTAD